MSKNREEIIQGIEENYLHMPYNKMLWLRLEFMMLCEDEIEALIMRVVEYEIEGARQYWLRKAQDCAHEGKSIPEEPEHWWVTLSYKQFQVRLYGAIKNEKTIINKLNVLIKTKQFILRRKDPNNEYGAPQYTFNKEFVQDRLNALPILPSLKDAAKRVEVQTKTPVPSSGTPPVDEEKGDQYHLVVPPVPSSGTPRTSDYYPPVPSAGTPRYQVVVPVNNSNNNKETKEEEKNDIAIANAIRYTHPLHSFLSFDDLMKPTIMIISLTSKQFESEMEDDRRYRVAGEIEHELTVKGFPVTVQTTHDKDDEVVESHVTKDATTATQPSLLLVEESVPPTQPVKTKQAQPKEKKEAAAKPVQAKKPRKIPGVPDEEAALRDQVHEWVNKHRGYALTGRASVKQVIDENRACVTLGNMLYRRLHLDDPTGCAWDDLEKEWEYISKKDKYWSQPDNRVRIGAQTILQMFAQTMPKISKSVTRSASTGTGMTHDGAQQLAADALAQTKQHGYSKIQATAYHQDGTWLVKVVWEDGNPLSPIKSREDWNKAFKENYEMDQEDQKGAK